MKCGSNHFCLGFEPDHKVYCYGSNAGCLWGQNTCTADKDCSKYSTSSAKYTDGDTPQCGKNMGWRQDACPDPYAVAPAPVAVAPTFNAIQTKFNNDKGEYSDLMNQLQASCARLTTPIQGLILNYRVQNGAVYDTVSNTKATVVNPTYGNQDLTLDKSYILTKSLRAGESISVFLWVYPMGDGVILTELGQSGINQNWHDSQIEMVNGMMKFSVWPYSIVLEHSVPLNQWHHVGFVYSQSETHLTAYVDGVEVSSGHMTRQSPNTLFYAIGATDTTNLGNGGYGHFRFAGMQVYNSALNPAEVLQHYHMPTVTKQCKMAAELNASMQTSLLQMSALLKKTHVPEQKALMELAAELGEARDQLLSTAMEQDDLTVMGERNYGLWIVWLISSIIVCILLYLFGK